MNQPLIVTGAFGETRIAASTSPSVVLMVDETTRHSDADMAEIAARLETILRPKEDR